ncbi:hypothetical protein A9D14_12485 [Croceicoccus marinus]|uniref:Uncharacterized protein n=1 Tax=Croceicoccus marinus TaxID=450378 RepID=A0A1Z1FDD1_9SPHN|nr:hypothetical protein A9D14_12485 [Croceicoccus marinus]
MPSDSLLVADLIIECPLVPTDEMRDVLISFAERNSQKADVQEISPSYLRMHMDGAGFGHSIFVEQWTLEGNSENNRCSSRSSVCVNAMVFAGGSIPEDELTENTARQRQVAHLLEEALTGTCER